MPRVVIGPHEDIYESALGTLREYRLRAEERIIRGVDPSPVESSPRWEGVRNAFENQHRAMFGEDPNGEYKGRINKYFDVLNGRRSTVEFGRGSSEGPSYTVSLDMVTDRDLPTAAMEVWRVGENGDERHMHIVHNPKPVHDTTSHIPDSYYERFLNILGSPPPISFTYPQRVPEPTYSYSVEFIDDYPPPTTRETLEALVPGSRVEEVPVEHGTFYQVFEGTGE
jgi:hypothetical protein